MSSLLKIRLFSEIQKFFDELTPEILQDLPGGKPAPENAVFFGELTIELKMLLHFCLMSRHESRLCLDTLITNGQSMTPEERAIEMQKMYEYQNQYHSAAKMFRLALCCEFMISSAAPFGFDDKFQVYALGR